MKGITTVQCMICKKKFHLLGYLATANEIWLRDEGLECCNQQTHIIKQEEE